MLEMEAQSIGSKENSTGVDAGLAIAIIGLRFIQMYHSWKRKVTGLADPSDEVGDTLEAEHGDYWSTEKMSDRGGSYVGDIVKRAL